VVDQFRREATELAGFELRQKLWHSCVVVCEVTSDYADWHLTLSDIAHKAGISEREVITTVKSARRKAGVA
jgi:DNA-binding transcriptional regulator LsrR (DeoR family)